MFNRIKLAAAALLACAAASPAFATITFIQCPAWAHATSAWFSDPGTAVVDGLNRSTQITQSCKPVKLNSCTHPANDATTFTCTVSYTNCTGQTAGQAVGSGYPIVGNQIFKSSDSSNITQCAISWFDWDPLKNKGDCPTCKGNPINVGSGNKYQREVDIPSSGEGSLEFARYYNSVLPFMGGPMGLQWTHSYQRYLTFRGATEIRAFRGDGKGLPYNLVGGVWQSDLDVPDLLTQVGANWQLITANDEIETYDGGGRLLSIQSRSGKVMTLTYSDGTASGPNGALMDGTTNALNAGLLIRVTDFKGRSLVLSYNWNSPAFPDTSDECEYGTGGVEWRSGYSRPNSNGRQFDLRVSRACLGCERQRSWGFMSTS